MNGIEKITERIASDTTAEIAKIHAESKATCDEIAKNSAAAAQEEYWKILKQGTQNAERRLERLNSVAELEAKKYILGEKQNLITKTFERAVEMLLALPDDKYVALLARLASEASVTGSEEIILSAKDKPRFGKAACEKANELLKASGRKDALTLSQVTRNICGGLVLSEGNIETNCSLDVLVSMYRNELLTAVAKTLFD